MVIYLDDIIVFGDNPDCVWVGGNCNHYRMLNGGTVHVECEKFSFFGEGDQMVGF